jgi:alkaline phosphatase D
MVRGIAILPFVSTALAAFVGNINYFSPSLHHPSLGVSISKVAKRTYASSPWDPAKLNFTHGIASGDPFDDSVILWTRAAPSSDNDNSNVTVSGFVPLFDHDNEKYVSKSDSPVCVDWKISATDSFATLADSGTVYTSSDVDYTVKVEAKKLQPFTTYCMQQRLSYVRWVSLHS